MGVQVVHGLIMNDVIFVLPLVDRNISVEMTVDKWQLNSYACPWSVCELVSFLRTFALGVEVLPVCYYESLPYQPFIASGTVSVQ